MKIQELVQQRLSNQLVSNRRYAKPDQVVRWMGAIQAQNLPAAINAIGVRVSPLRKLTVDDVEQAIVDRKIVRTWPMRGTLHLVPADDVRWMLNLLTPRVIKSTAGRYRQLELDEDAFKKSGTAIEKALEGGGQLTRLEIYSILEEAGISPHGQRGIHILGHLAQKGVICFGPKKGKQPTFVLLEEWLPNGKMLEKDEGLATLAARYFKSHGPATVHDFAYWSGLTLADAKVGVELVKGELDYEVMEGKAYFFSVLEVEERPLHDDEVFLLPAFDEMLCGYKDKTATFRSTDIKSTILKNGIIQSMIIAENQTIGTWTQHVKKESVIIGAHLFKEISALEKQKIEEKAVELGYFLNKHATVHFL